MGWAKGSPESDFWALDCLPNKHHIQFDSRFITVQNSGKWLTWNICTGGMGYAGYKGNMEYLH